MKTMAKACVPEMLLELIIIASLSNGLQCIVNQLLAQALLQGMLLSMDKITHRPMGENNQAC